MPTVDERAPGRFLEAAFEPQDWLAVFLKSHGTGQTAQRVGPRSMLMDARFQAWLRWRNSQRWDVYVGVNAVTAGQRSRRRNAIAAVRHVFLDADHGGDLVLAAIEARPDLALPSCVLRTSPGRMHLLWRVTGFPPHVAEAVQRQLASELGTDMAATPSTQTTRLPGFVSYKRSTPFMVSAEYRSAAHIFGPSDFPTVALAPAHPANHEPRASATCSCTRAERVRSYLAAVPPAVQGQRGDQRTYRVCCRLVRGFALSDTEALSALADWNARCSPPWSERDLREKVRRARRYGREPEGGLLRASATEPAPRAAHRRALEG